MQRRTNGASIILHTQPTLYAYIHPEQFYMTSNGTHYISSLKHQKLFIL